MSETIYSPLDGLLGSEIPVSDTGEFVRTVRMGDNGIVSTMAMPVAASFADSSAPSDSTLSTLYRIYTPPAPGSFDPFTVGLTGAIPAFFTYGRGGSDAAFRPPIRSGGGGGGAGGDGGGGGGRPGQPPPFSFMPNPPGVTTIGTGGGGGGGGGGLGGAGGGGGLGGLGGTGGAGGTGGTGPGGGPGGTIPGIPGVPGVPGGVSGVAGPAGGTYVFNPESGFLPGVMPSTGNFMRDITNAFNTPNFVNNLVTAFSPAGILSLGAGTALSQAFGETPRVTGVIGALTDLARDSRLTPEQRQLAREAVAGLEYESWRAAQNRMGITAENLPAPTTPAPTPQTPGTPAAAPGPDSAQGGSEGRGALDSLTPGTPGQQGAQGAATAPGTTTAPGTPGTPDEAPAEDQQQTNVNANQPAASPTDMAVAGIQAAQANLAQAQLAASLEPNNPFSFAEVENARGALSAAMAFAESVLADPNPRGGFENVFNISRDVAPSRQGPVTVTIESRPVTISRTVTPALVNLTEALEFGDEAETAAALDALSQAISMGLGPESAGWGGPTAEAQAEAAQAAANAAAAQADADAQPGGVNDSDGGGGGGGGGSKIVCTAMNEAYGFGSYRNKIWLAYSAKHMSKAHEVGYHTIFLPLVAAAYHKSKWYSKPLQKTLEHIARHRTADLRAEMKNSKRDMLGRAYRAVLEPLCYIVGKVKGY